MKQILITLTDEEYEDIINDEACGLHPLTRAVARGVVLPEHYGDLIDRNSLIKDRVENDNVVIVAKNAPTIIEATGGE